MATPAEAMTFDPSTAVPAEELDPASAAPAAFDPSTAVPEAEDAGVDYDTGLSFLDRAHLAQADNPAEMRKYLESVYGKENVKEFKGKKGQDFYVTKDGKKLAASGGGFWSGLGADLVGNSPQITGAGLGALQGAGIGSAVLPGVGTAIGALGGAAIGGMAGKTVQEGGKAIAGTYSKSPNEYIKTIGKSGVLNAAGEGLGQVVTRAGSRFLRGKLPPILSQTTPETDAMTERMLGPEKLKVGPLAKRADDAKRSDLGYESSEPYKAAPGARPHAEATMPGMKSIQFTEALAAKASGKVRGQEDANTKYVETRMRKILQDSGVPPAQLDATMREIASGESRIPSEEVGEHVKRAAIAHREMLESNVNTALEGVNREVEASQAHLDKIMQHFRSDSLGVDVAGAIRKARSDFGTSMSKVYGKVDQMVGDQPLVPTNIFRQEARRLGRRLLQSSQPAATREMSQIGTPTSQAMGAEDTALFESLGIQIPPSESGKISFADAQRIRTLLRQADDDGNLTRGIKAGELSHLADMVDYSIQAAARDPVAAPAVRMLNAADGAYRKGIAKFNDVTVRRLVKDLEAGIQPDPETVAKTIVQPGQEARVKIIRGLIGEQNWRGVMSADYSRMVNSATDADGTVSGVTFLSEIKKRGKLMDTVYGDKFSKEITDMARTIAARDGKLPPEVLAPGNLKNSIDALRMAQSREEAFMRQNALSAIANPKKSPERVYNWISHPDNGSALKSAIEMFGENSEQTAQLRQAALRNVLNQAKISTAEGKPETALLDALRKYTPEQRAILFPNHLDADISLLGKEIALLMKAPSDESKAGFAAGALLGLGVAGYPIRVALGAYQWLLSRPGMIRYLAVGLKSPSGGARTATREMLKNLVRYGTVSAGEGVGDETELGTGQVNGGLGQEGAGGGQHGGQAVNGGQDPQMGAAQAPGQ